jgi:hypothetical protein
MLSVTLADTATLLLVASMIGSIDVFWFHLWRLRLYRQPSSVAEEASHLASYATFIAIAAALLTTDNPQDGRGLVLGLFAINLTITAADVLLERRSRAPLGGLPSLEYLLHVLVTFGIGGAAATFWWASSTDTGAHLEGLDRTRVIGAIVFTTVLLAVEGVLYGRALLTRRKQVRLQTAPA